MAVFYSKIQRRNPAKPSAPPKWYPVIRSLGLLREKEVAKQIADETTLNPKEAEMALAQFEKVLIHTLLEGKTIQLGDWGSFYLTLSSEGSDKEAEVTAQKIKKVNLRFKAGKDLRKAIEKVEFRDVHSRLGK